MLHAIESFDHHDESGLACKVDASPARVCQGGYLDGRYHADGFVETDFSEFFMNSGFGLAFYEYALAGTADEVIISVDLKPDYSGGSPVIWDGDFLQAGLGTGIIPATYTRQVIACCDGASGKIQFYQYRTNKNFDYLTWPGTTSILLAETDPGLITWQPWNRFDFRFSASGEIEVRKNNISVFSATGISGLTGGFNRAGSVHNRFGQVGHVQDNLYVLTRTGGVRTDYIPAARVSAWFPISDVVSQWFPNTGVYHYALVDDRSVPLFNAGMPDGDTTYVESSVASHQDLWKIQRPHTFDGGLLGIQLTAYARNMSAVDSASIRLVAHSFTADYKYGPYAIPVGYSVHGSSYKGIRILLETNPETGLNWTDNELANWSFGIENAANVQTRVTQFVVEKITGSVSVGSTCYYEGRQVR